MKAQTRKRTRDYKDMVVGQLVSIAHETSRHGNQ